MTREKLGEKALLLSHVVIFYDDPAVCEPLQQWLEAFAWHCHCTTDVSRAVDDDPVPALILIDGTIEADKRTHFIKAIRALYGSAAGTPILLIADPAAPGQPGTVGRIDTPLRRAEVVAHLEQWAGPLADHGFRDLSDPHYRLVRLGGRTMADDMMLRFVTHLEDALARLSSGDGLARVAHEIAGLAGTIGYGEISALWSAIEHGDSGKEDDAIAATGAAIQQLKGRFSGK